MAKKKRKPVNHKNRQHQSELRDRPVELVDMVRRVFKRRIQDV